MISFDSQPLSFDRRRGQGGSGSRDEQTDGWIKRKHGYLSVLLSSAPQSVSVSPWSRLSRALSSPSPSRHTLAFSSPSPAEPWSEMPGECHEWETYNKWERHTHQNRHLHPAWPRFCTHSKDRKDWPLVDSNSDYWFSFKTQDSSQSVFLNHVFC